MVPRFSEEALSRAEFERVGVAQSVGMRPLVDLGLAGEAGQEGPDLRRWKRIPT